MIDYILYSPLGEIVSYGQAPSVDMALHQVRQNTNISFTKFRGEQYMIVNDEHVLRPVFESFDKTTINADGVDVATMNVPIGCEISINGISHTNDDGTLELVAKYPGEYTIEINHWPYMPFKQVITCL